MIIEPIVRRRSVRDFSPTPVSAQTLDELLTAAMYAPSSRDNRAVEFIVVRDAAVKQALFGVAGQEFLRQAPALVIPVTDPSRTHQPIQDISLASANLMLQAAAMGLGTVWKHLPEEVATAVKNRLGIPADRIVVNVMPVGTPIQPLDPHQPSEFDRHRVHAEKW